MRQKQRVRPERRKTNANRRHAKYAGRRGYQRAATDVIGRLGAALLPFAEGMRHMLLPKTLVRVPDYPTSVEVDPGVLACDD